MILQRALVLSLLGLPWCQAASSVHWVASWGASPSPQRNEAEMEEAKLIFENQTVREVVHLSLGGKQVRVRLSNAYGKAAAEIGSAHVALSEKSGRVLANSDRPLSFSGRASVTIPPDGSAISDPVELSVADGADLAVSLFLPKRTSAGGVHYSSQQTSYIGRGDSTGAAAIPEGSTVESWVFISGVDIAAPEHAGTLVTFGDSITDGARSTTDANHRWPNFLAERMRTNKQVSLGVLDAGIGGNRLLHDAVGNVRFGVNALARFDRDVLAQPGVKYLVVLEGINDIGHPGSSAPEAESVSAEDLIAALRQLAERAHEHGIKVFGCTLTPFTGTTYTGYFSAEKEAKRQAVNQWIRKGEGWDGVIDFDKATQDPAHPERLKPAYDSGDHLHPNDAGYKAMAEAVDLKLFR